MKNLFSQTKKLLQQIRSGNKQALEKFYVEQHEPFVKWLQKQYSISEEMAVEIYQESVLLMYRNILENRFEAKNSSLKTYLFAIGKNICLSKLRKQQKERQLFVKMDKITIENTTDTKEIVLDSSKLTAAIQETLNNMKEPCKSIITMSFLYDLPPESIAKKLNYKSLQVFYTQKSRCLKKLQLIFKKHHSKDDFLS